MSQTEYPPIVQVDEAGNPIGPLNYSDAHSQGIAHMTAAALLFNKTRKKILLSLRGNVTRGGVWDASAGGHASWLTNRAETPDEIIYREGTEELFYENVWPEELVLARRASFWKQTRPTDREFAYLFDGIYDGPFFPNPEEVSEVRFFGVDETIRDIENNPERYTRSLGVFLKKYIEVQQ